MALMTQSHTLNSLPSEGLLKEKQIFLHRLALDLILRRTENPIVDVCSRCVVLQYCRWI